MATTTQYITLIKEYVTTQGTISDINKANFDSAWYVLKGVKKIDRVEEFKAIKKLAEKEIKVDSIRLGFIRLMDMCITYAITPDNVLNKGVANWDNFKGVLRLVKRVEKYYNSDMSKLDKLVAVWEQGMSEYRYNNMLSAVIKEVGLDIPAIIPKKEVPFSTVKSEVEGLSAEDKTALLEMLLSDLGYSIEDVA